MINSRMPSDCSVGAGSCSKSGDHSGAGDGGASISSLLRTPSLLSTVCDLVNPPACCGETCKMSSGEYGTLLSYPGSIAMDRRSAVLLSAIELHSRRDAA